MMKPSISGVGALSPLGLDLESFWNSILAEKNCVQSGIGAFSDEQWKEILSRAQATSEIGKVAGKVALLSYVAAQEAMKKASWDSLNEDDGLILGTTTGQVGRWESLLMQGYRENCFEEFTNAGGIVTPGASLRELKNLLGFKGKSMMIVSACSASTQALGLAAEWVKSGRVKRCLVGGSEILTRLSVEGFRSLGLLSTEPSKPFDETRSGINLSEGAAFFCVEALENPRRSVANIRGFATNSDAYHLTAPQPEGLGSLAVFEDVLKNAGLVANDIDWIHAHGTASPSNDQSEGMAISKLFPKTPVTSTKGYHGHSLGASGALEVALCVQSLRQQLILKTLGCETLDPKLSISLQREHQKTELRYLMKNSLGFGGVNASLILENPQGALS